MLRARRRGARDDGDDFRDPDGAEFDLAVLGLVDDLPGAGCFFALLEVGFFDVVFNGAAFAEVDFAVDAFPCLFGAGLPVTAAFLSEPLGFDAGLDVDVPAREAVVFRAAGFGVGREAPDGADAAFAAASSSARRACSSRARTAISLTASNSSRVTKSMRPIRSSARRRMADRVEPRMPTATLSAPERTPATSSTKRRIPNLPNGMTQKEGLTALTMEVKRSRCNATGTVPILCLHANHLVSWSAESS